MFARVLAMSLLTVKNTRRYRNKAKSWVVVSLGLHQHRRLNSLNAKVAII